MGKLEKLFPPGFARALLAGYRLHTTIPEEVPAAALLVALTLPLIKPKAVVERKPEIHVDLRLWVTAAGQSGAGKTTGVRDVRKRIGDCGVALLGEASGPVGLLESLAELNGNAALRIVEEAGLHWQALRDGDRNAVELQRYDLRLFDCDPITRRSGEKTIELTPGPLSSLEFCVTSQLNGSLCRADIESGFASRRCWMVVADIPVDKDRVKRLHHWDFNAISKLLEKTPLPNPPVEPVYQLSEKANKAWDRAWRRLVDQHLESVGEAYLRRADTAGLVCAVICRRIADKEGPILDSEDVERGSAFADLFCEGASDLIKRVAGGHFQKRLKDYEEWVSEYMFTNGHEPTVREFQRHDQRNLNAEISRRVLPDCCGRLKVDHLEGVSPTEN